MTDSEIKHLINRKKGLIINHKETLKQIGYRLDSNTYSNFKALIKKEKADIKQLKLYHK